MGTELRILIVEDSEDGALLVVRELELRRSSYESIFERVDTAEAMHEALLERTQRSSLALRAIRCHLGVEYA